MHPKTANRLKPGKNDPITEHNEHYRTLHRVFDWDAIGSVKRGFDGFLGRFWA